MTAEPLTRNREQVVDGIYRLGRILHNSAADTIYETTFGDEATAAVIRIQRGGTPDAERLVARWRKATEFSHPNLIPVYAAGSTVLDDIPVIYVVTQRADESLAGVLAERALSEQAVLDMLTPTLSALAYLHKNRHAHGSLKPSNVLAAGDLLKLSGDKATAFADGGSASDDVWALGSLIVQALTRKPPKIEHDWAPYILREASEPFIDVVRNCLESNPHLRWTVSEVAARLDLKLVVAPPPAPLAKKEVVITEQPPVAAEAAPVAEAVPAQKAAEQQTNPDQLKPVERARPHLVPKPVVNQPTMVQRPIIDEDPALDEPVFDDPVLKQTKAESGTGEREREKLFADQEDKPQASNRKLVYGGIAALVLVGALVGIGRLKDSAPAAVATNPPVIETAPAQPPVTPRPSPIPKSTSPQRPQPRRSEGSPPARDSSSHPAGRHADGWSVVVGSYVSRAPAEKRANEMTRRWPKFTASVFEQKANRTYYLVVIGQNLSQDQAQSLRKRAVSSGLPRDTYVKRFGQ